MDQNKQKTINNTPKTKEYEKISRLLIYGFVFGLREEMKEFKCKGEIIPEYCRIIPYQNKDGELAIKVNIAVEETTEEHKCKISIFDFESESLYPDLFCFENVFFYDLYTNNDNGQLEQYHIFVYEDDDDNK